MRKFYLQITVREGSVRWLPLHHYIRQYFNYVSAQMHNKARVVAQLSEELPSNTDQEEETLCSTYQGEPELL